MAENNSIDDKTALEKAKQFCAYQERCVFEVRKKLGDWKLGNESIEKIIIRLEEEDYLDETRFAKVFAGGKFRIKKWGKIKIKAALRAKKIPEAIIQIGLEEIDEQEYIEAMKGIIKDKKEEYNKSNSVSIRNKIYNFVVSKGYEKHEILKYL